ncbi:hypothetical protein ACLI1A_00530 [Flavobacterium sp. RHBU_3]|uniref:hypothetical protein n=1 Tax=Flavobacterium sp. RHBU_3 TaxID=3391184 RepID=UPI0039854D9A
MKKIALLLIALVSLSGFAQQRLQGGKQNLVFKKTAKATPEQRAKELTIQLDLTPVQEAQVKALFEEDDKNHPAEVKKTPQKGDMLETPKDKEIKAQEKKAERVEFEGKMKKVLTPEQFEKWKKNRDAKPAKEVKKLDENNLQEKTKL